MPYKKKKSFKRKKRYSPRAKRNAAGRQTTKRGRANAFQVMPGLPKTLGISMSYHGSTLMKPSSVAGERFAGISIDASSLNPGIHFKHGFGATGLKRIWPRDTTVGTLTKSNPMSDVVLGMKRMDGFYHHFYVDSSKITFNIRVLPGQQPDRHTPSLAQSYTNDFYTGLSAAGLPVNSATGDAAYEILKTGFKRSRLNNVTPGGADGAFSLSTTYNPRQYLGIRDPSDNDKLSVLSEVNTDPAGLPTLQPQCVERTYFNLYMTPTYDPAGAYVKQAPPMPEFKVDYKIEYNVKFYEKRSGISRLKLPLVMKSMKNLTRTRRRGGKSRTARR